MKKTTESRPAAATDREVLRLAMVLQALGVNPEEFLSRVVRAELGTRDLGPFDPVRAIRADRSAIYSPSVLEALLRASFICGGTPPEKPLLNPTARSAQSLLMRVFLAMRSPVLLIREIEAVKRRRETLALAREVDAEADRVAEARALEISPVDLALRHVARAHKTTPVALRKRIQLARKADPAAPWPKKKARRL
jgi:hypothetical protein